MVFTLYADKITMENIAFKNEQSVKDKVSFGTSPFSKKQTRSLPVPIYIYISVHIYTGSSHSVKDIISAFSKFCL